MIELIHGDCLIEMAKMSENSVDSIVTDPPYGLSFMGKKWDYEVPSVDIWKEALRVLKPGGFLLAFAGTRTQHRMCVNIEDAGFEIRDMIAWIYGSGFPKSLDVSKAIDKKNGRFFDDGFMDYCNEKRKEKNYSLSKINILMDTALTGGGFASCVMGDKEHNELPTVKNYNKLKAILEMDSRYDELIERVEAEREVIGQKTSACFSDEKRHTIGASESQEVNITAPATSEAKEWDGWGTALKPCMELISVCRKPLSERTVASNVLKHGTGGINIDGCRIEGGERDARENNISWGIDRIAQENEIRGNKAIGKTTQGRWPGNVIHDGSDEVEALFPETNPGKSGGKAGWQEGGYVGGELKNEIERTRYDDFGGSASRFFYCAKASKSDRGKGNNHPTVKPTDLMRYLVRLVTPKKGTCLDCFMGSGSTAKAAKLEGFNFIGIELDEAYCEIAQKRIDAILAIQNEIEWVE